MAEPVVIKWSWRRFVLQAEEFDSVEEAVQSAHWTEESGDEARGWIEVADDNGVRLLTPEEWRAIEEPMRAAEDAEWDARAAGPLWSVEVYAPDESKWARVHAFAASAEAEAAGERLAAALGLGRVRVSAVVR